MNQLSDLLTPQSFGRAMQQVLAFMFVLAGFEVVENAVGVPDFTASGTVKTSFSGALAIEVKTSDTQRIVVSKRDLAGVSAAGYVGVLAVLEYPSLDPEWHLIKADSLVARVWEVRYLKRQVMANPGFDVNSQFRRYVSQLHPEVLGEGVEFDAWMKEEKRAFLTRK